MGSGSTTRLAIPFPVGTDPNNIPLDLSALANRLDAIDATLSGVETLSNKTLTAPTINGVVTGGTGWLIDASGYVIGKNDAKTAPWSPGWLVGGTTAPSAGTGTGYAKRIGDFVVVFGKYTWSTGQTLATDIQANLTSLPMIATGQVATSTWVKLTNSDLVMTNSGTCWISSSGFAFHCAGTSGLTFNAGDSLSFTAVFFAGTSG